MYNARQYIGKASNDKVALQMQNILYSYIDGISYEEADAEQKKMLLELHELCFGPHFDTGIAIDAVAKMENVDGTTGAH